MALRSKYIIFAVGLASLLGVLTFRSTEKYQSCASCRNFRSISSRSVFGVTVYKSERLDISTVIPTGHSHDWKGFSTHETSVFGKSIGCRAHRFADGTDF